MTPDDALKVVMEAADFYANGKLPTKISMSDAHEALALLKDKHLFVSRFKPGDKVFIVSCAWDDDYEERTSDWYAANHMHVQRIVFGQIMKQEARISIDPGDTVSSSWSESDCFPTRAAAEAEAKRRNRGGEK